MGKIELTVKEAPKTDVGRGIVRLTSDAMEELGVQSGSVVSIKGPKGTAGIVWRGLPEDEGKDIIRMDGVIRGNTGAGIDDQVSVETVEPKYAKKVVLSPTQPIQYGSGFVEYVHERLLNKPLVKGDRVLVDVMGTPLTFVATGTSPTGVVVVSEETNLSISNKPVTEKAGVPNISYEDIGGLEEEIETIREMIEVPMRYPQVFKKLGVSPPKGILLQGPPGTGKTLLAKAVANETEAHFISIAGPEVVSKWYGQSEENLRNVFKEAQENAPAIIFIDEIDAIAPAREEVHGEVEKRMVSQLLTLMDGLEARGEVVVIAATNRPDAVDPALRRPGRFDRELQIGIPARKGRKEILQIHTRGMPLTKDVNLDKLADITHGYSGADVEALAKEAAMRALRRVMPDLKKVKDGDISKEVLDNIQVTNQDFQEAMKRVEPSAMREVLVEIPRVSWKDIGGLKSVKEELIESIEWPLKHAKLFKEVGVTTPKGILLFGPPGTGKTLLAKAVANESQANFISVKGPELLNKWVGESERGVRKVFKRARQVAPSIIFFDEIESLTGTRGMSDGSGVKESVVAQLLSEIDGVSELKDVVLIGASNRPDLIDPALLRPGRFEKLVYVPMPDAVARKDIFGVHMRGMKVEGVDVDQLVKRTEGYSGADIEAVVRKAGLLAIREIVTGRKKEGKVQMKHFDAALEKMRPSVTAEQLSSFRKVPTAKTGDASVA
ncbi:MAG: CDC48 family AAA ATPase [Candidatus Altiarchaeota archaeon]|nr:CDC48 family AAA ATPase [Candidatus Altiarchaeota archaeon]